MYCMCCAAVGICAAVAVGICAAVAVGILAICAAVSPNPRAGAAVELPRCPPADGMSKLCPGIAVLLCLGTWLVVGAKVGHAVAYGAYVGIGLSSEGGGSFDNSKSVACATNVRDTSCGAGGVLVVVVGAAVSVLSKNVPKDVSISGTITRNLVSNFEIMEISWPEK